MKRLWNYINNKNWNETTKNRMMLLVLSLASAAAGLVFWLIIRSISFSGPEWLFCFTGYPAVTAFFVTSVYLLKHDFS